MKLIICILCQTAMAVTAEGDLAAVFKQGNDQFTSQMFYEVTKAHPGKSVILSAFSVLPPLGQLALASVGESHDELLRAIGLPNDNITKAVFKNLNQQLRLVKGVELRMANRIYIANDAQLNTRFAALSRDVFNSDVKNVDFTMNKQTANDINTWVEGQTNHKIKDLVSADSLEPGTRAVLVNAIYFKGSWKHKFDKKLTVDREFHVSKSNSVRVPTMSKRGHFRYSESTELDAKLLELPYEDNDSSFLVILPNQIEGITDLQEKLKDSSLLENAVQKMYSYEVDVLLPKFKIETTTNLKEVLTKMNITKMFSARDARLENLLSNESNLFITTAIQKAFIEVNEDGAEAAAANAIGLGSAGPGHQPIVKIFIANRPFYFGIIHKGNTLFNGAVVVPKPHQI